jgi:hypothetical protein
MFNNEQLSNYMVLDRFLEIVSILLNHTFFMFLNLTKYIQKK